MIQDALAKMAVETAVKDFAKGKISNPYKRGTGMFIMYDNAVRRIEADLADTVEFMKAIKE